jgi:hypothetical protein
MRNYIISLLLVFFLIVPYWGCNREEKIQNEGLTIALVLKTLNNPCYRQSQ